jgi:ubiquinone/menaquinone biosynthesis C-methylase UbiE
MDRNTLSLIADLHIRNKRQGPGSDETVRKILGILDIGKNSKLEIADIGCGTGASAIEILKNTCAKITAVDFLPEFLEKLRNEANKLGFADRINLIEKDMAELPFDESQFDLIWSEGAVYNIGFERGVNKWRKFLKKHGYIVLTEITWLRKNVPEEIKKYWHREYPEIDTAENKIKILKNSGFEMVDYFVLPENCWLDEYYTPLESSFGDFLERNTGKAAHQIIDENKKEIELYKKYKDYYSYGVYIAKKI